MKLFIDIVMKRIYLFNTVAWNYRKKIGFPVCKKENFAGLQAHRKSGKSARASPTPQHTLNEERSARFIALSALIQAFDISVPFSLLICSLGDLGGDNCSLLYQTKVPVLVSINRLKLVPDKWIVPVLFLVFENGWGLISFTGTNDSHEISPQPGGHSILCTLHLFYPKILYYTFGRRIQTTMIIFN